jgi:hypothetical protein
MEKGNPNQNNVQKREAKSFTLIKSLFVCYIKPQVIIIHVDFIIDKRNPQLWERYESIL